MKIVPLRKPTAREAAAQVRVEEGLVVARKYRLVKKLGAGAMGTVWQATHVMLGHGVAIKFLHAPVEGFDEGFSRFEREGKLAARLGETSRHICRVTDFGVLDDGTPYVVMELLHGEELSARLKREGRLPLPHVAEITTQLCHALTAAHRAGVVHRDLKPANIFLCTSDDGRPLVKLLDFGVAKAAIDEEGTEGTRAGLVFGTLAYMSPEQIAGEPLDGRADLWAVAVMVYRMAVGRPPYGVGSLRELGIRIMTTEPAVPSSVWPDLPKSFDAWIQKGLAKQRADRFETARELAASLHEVSRAEAGDASTTSARSGGTALFLNQPSMALREARWAKLALIIGLPLSVLWIARARTLESPVATTYAPQSVAGAPDLRVRRVVPFTVQPDATFEAPEAQEPREERTRKPRTAPDHRSRQAAHKKAESPPASQEGPKRPQEGSVAQRAATLWNKVDEL